MAGGTVHSQIYPGEGRVVGLVLAHFFLISAARGLLYVAAMGLFLKTFEASSVPWIFVGLGVAGGALSAAYLTLAGRVRYSRLLIGTVIGAALLTLFVEELA